MEIKTIEGKRTILRQKVEVETGVIRTVVGNTTPRKLEVAKMSKGRMLNRNERRNLLFKNKAGQLKASIAGLRNEILESKIKVPSMPRGCSAKVLSGYKSQLLKLVYAK